METVYEQFANGIVHYGQRLELGTASLEPQNAALRMKVTDASRQRYSNAQIDDYRGLPRRRFPWQPPLKLSVRARFSTSDPNLQGTAGFGFWNDPFLMTERRFPALPRAIWFFYASPDSDMKLDWQVDGHGWKAATIDAARARGILWLPTAPLLVPLMNLNVLYRLLWPSIQRSLGIREARLRVDMTHWHTYILEWGIEQSTFRLSGEANPQPEPVLQAPSPAGPLGFVMWLDNQFLVLTPWGRFRWGLAENPGQQWMEVDWFKIESMG